MTIPKFYVISKIGDDVCDRLSKECIESAEKFNISCEVIPGVYENQHKLIKKYKLEYFKYKDVGRRYTNGVLGCFLSHFLLWKKCIELQEPIGIFEYDALMVSPITPELLNYTDVLHLGGADPSGVTQSIVKLPQVSPLSISYNSIKKNFIVGTHAYIISPTGAMKLINAAYDHGFLFADLHINLNYVEIYRPQLDVAIVNPFMQEHRKSLSHTLKNF
jgi:GR25 family glycosyltransferase involved in LPS biosynthesis